MASANWTPARVMPWLTHSFNLLVSSRVRLAPEDVELLRVLFANNIGPVLLLAYTHHALDQRRRRSSVLRLTPSSGLPSYQCPNGHPFAVGQCGQTMQEAHCPECGATIGGTLHQLRSDNTRDEEFEGIARGLGGQQKLCCD